jgi:succinate dehydrogenase / fumarate reductase cytochrome b subunit|tara:strand:+ start:8046 stop:8447 length:402 start_codon:yes stop_codon:yes gene_type:complete
MYIIYKSEFFMNNPLSPHLQIYRWQITSVLSILHRITGVVLSLGTIILSVWLLCLGLGETYFNFFNHLISSFIGRTIMIGYTWAVCFHTLNGIRHLGWDYGYGLELIAVKITGWTVILSSLVMTTIIWFLSVL